MIVGKRDPSAMQVVIFPVVDIMILIRAVPSLFSMIADVIAGKDSDWLFS